MANNPRHMDNLKNFQKGCKPPPTSGRPKGSKSLTTLLKNMLERDLTLTDKTTGLKETKTTAEWIASALLAKAASGDTPSTKEVFDRIEGKAIQKVNNITTLDFDSLDLSSLTDEQIEKLIADNTRSEQRENDE